MADNITYSGSGSTVPANTVQRTDDLGAAGHVPYVKIMDGTDGASTPAKVSSEGNLQTITPNRTANGTLGALNAAVTISCEDAGILSFYFASSNLVGTVVIDTDLDGSTWNEQFEGWFDAFNAVWASQASNPVAQQQLIIGCAQYRRIRLRVSAYTSGSAVVHATTGRELSAASYPLQGMRGFARANNDGYNPIQAGTGTEVLALRTVSATDSPDVTALQIMDDWDETDRAKVNSIVGQAGVAGGAGVSTAATQRVAIATDANAVSVASLPLPTGASTAALQTQPGVDIGDVTVNNAQGSGTAAAALRVELPTNGTGVVGLNAGTNAIGKLAANSGVDIGDVDVTSLPALPAGTNNIGDVDVLTLPALVAGSANIGDVDVLTVPAPLSTAGNGTAATAHRVTLASDSTGVIAVTQSGTWDEVGINDSGNSITVDGTVTNQPQKAATSAVTSVASSATNVTLLASSAGRLGATVYNDSTQVLFAKLGATASSSSFTVKMAPGSYFEVPYGYSGILDGIWASANGSARLTEVSA